MGEEPHRLGQPGRSDSPRELERLRSEIRGARRRLDVYVEELDRRRHRLLSAREHPMAAVAVGLGLASLAGGAVWLARRGVRRKARSFRRVRHYREALARASRHPERVASDAKSPWSRVLLAIAPIVVTKLADAALKARASAGRRGISDRPRPA